ncbi:MAG: hypothetical protein D6732_04960 [Methanobacteriota archaeon]|nr:MAG: hypothetical protein D6732_04960 [Euryarchaeota archaeon]
MTERLQITPENKTLIERIVIRLTEQGKDEIFYVLSKLFPEAKAMRLRSTAEDLAEKRDNRLSEFMNLVEIEPVDMEIFRSLSSADQDAQILQVRGDWKPTKFELTITCARTPLKEFFDECKDITCESCIQNRLGAFKPWDLVLRKVGQRRVDLCKNCGTILSKKDQIIMRNERMLYTCHYCGHKGWNPAK